MRSYIKGVRVLSVEELERLNPVPDRTGSRVRFLLDGGLRADYGERLCVCGLSGLKVESEIEHGVRSYHSHLRCRVYGGGDVRFGGRYGLLLEDTNGGLYLLGLPWGTLVRERLELESPERSSESVRDVLEFSWRGLYAPLLVMGGEI